MAGDADQCSDRIQEGLSTMSPLRQFCSVIWISISGVPSRLGASAVTVLSVALTVLTLLAFLGMSSGFSRTVGSAGSELVAVATSAGARAEATSRIPLEAVRVLAEARGLARDDDGRALVSAEALAVIDAPRITGGSANASLRGVTPAAAAMRTGFTLVDGRMFRPGGNELIVGASFAREFSGFGLGDDVRLGQSTWRVVGIFDVGGSVFDSEVWADLKVVQGAFHRADGVQVVRMRLDTPETLAEVQAFAAADPRLAVDIASERDYFAAQSDKLQLLAGFGWALALLLAVGALAGSLNTMYAAVEARARENATLRAIGFGRWAVFAGAMAESLALAAAGAIVAIVIALLLLNGFRTSTLGEGFSQVVFQLAIGPHEIMAGLAVALSLGVAGGLLPAMKSAAAPVLKLGE